MSAEPGGDTPFAALGLPARPGLTDDEVRAAWRRVAAATHPDRPDSGDPDRFALAAAAYTVLRTASGRGEALADLANLADRPWRRPPGTAVVRNRRGDSGLRPQPGAAARIRRGRPGVLALRVLIVAAIGAGTAAVAGWQPATPALITGALTWLLCTARHDIAPPSG